jgi:hypothetical protein
LVITMADVQSLASGSNDTREPTPQKKRKFSSVKVGGMYDDLVEQQFDENMTILKRKLENKKGLLTFLLGLLDSGKLEEAYNKQMTTIPGGPQLALFASSSKYMKQAGLVWFRDFLKSANPAGFELPLGANEEMAKTFRLDVVKGSELTCLALNVHKECWLLHRQCEIAMAEARLIYRTVGSRLKFQKAADDLKVKGFYTKEKEQIWCLALMADLEHPIFIDAPGGNHDWKFEENYSAYAKFVNGTDTFSLVERFTEKYPERFVPEEINPIWSTQPDGVSAHTSLGELTRRPLAKAKSNCRTPSAGPPGPPVAAPPAAILAAALPPAPPGGGSVVGAPPPAE